VDDFDFARDVSALRGVMQDEVTFSFTYVRANNSPTMSFFRLVRHPVGLEKFRQLLSVLPSHHQHVILCFSTSQMRWCFLSSPRRVCPFCGVSWKWEHFFSCQYLVVLLTSRNLSLQKTRCDIYESRWQDVFADIAHVLIVWSFSLNVTPDLALSYDTDVFRSLIQVVRAQSCA
jgi:hypothetical protein